MTRSDDPAAPGNRPSHPSNREEERLRQQGWPDDRTGDQAYERSRRDWPASDAHEQPSTRPSYAPQFDRFVSAYAEAQERAEAQDPGSQARHQPRDSRDEASWGWPQDSTQPVSAYPQGGAPGDPSQPGTYFMPEGEPQVLGTPTRPGYESGRTPHGGHAADEPPSRADQRQDYFGGDAGYRDQRYAAADPGHPHPRAQDAYHPPAGTPDQGGFDTGFRQDPNPFEQAHASDRSDPRYGAPVSQEPMYGEPVFDAPRTGPRADDNPAEQLQSYFDQVRDADEPIAHDGAGWPSQGRVSQHDQAVQAAGDWPMQDRRRESGAPAGWPGGFADHASAQMHEARGPGGWPEETQPGQAMPQGYGDAQYAPPPDDYAYPEAAMSEGLEEPGEPRGRRGLLVIGALVAAVGIGGGLGFAYKFLGGGGEVSSNPPVVFAEQDPVKTQPDDPGGKTFEHQKKAIYDRLNGNGQSEQDARLVNRAEDVQPRTRDRQRDDTGNADPARRAAETARDSGRDALAAAEAALNGTAQEGAETARRAAADAAERTREPVAGVRRVRTVRVNPDGTFTEMPSSNQPRRNESTGGGAVIPGITIDGGTTAQTRTPRNTEGQPESAATQRQASNAADTGSDADAFDPPQPNRVSRERTRVASLNANTQQRNSTATDASVTSQPTSTAVGAGGFVAQIAARRNLQDALATFVNLRDRYPSVLSSKQPDIQEATLSSGKWFRVRVGPPVSKPAAQDLCTRLKSAGWDGCLVKSYE